MMWTQHLRASMGCRALTEACKRVQRDVGLIMEGSRAKQLRKGALALLQVQGNTSEAVDALLHWKLSLQQQVYSNENPEAMLASQGQPAFGQELLCHGEGQGGHSELSQADQAFIPRQYLLR